MHKTKSFRKMLAFPVILAGLVLVFYPWLSNYLFEHRVDSIVNSYQEQTMEQDTEELDRMKEAADSYNERLAGAQIQLTDPFTLDIREEEAAYEELLETGNSGESSANPMCFVDIPKINVYLPVYHGTSTEVLEKGIGHLEGSSLPVGGEGTHAVLSGHTGINSAKLFTDLIDMEEGDIFFLHVLGETLAYRVVRILVIEPDQTDALKIEKGRDLVSLVTCTPYGINSHRLVVTGERVSYTEEIKEEADCETSENSSLWMESYKKAVCLGLVLAMGLSVFAAVLEKRKKKNSGINSRHKQA